MDKKSSFNRRSFIALSTLASFGGFSTSLLNASNHYSVNRRIIFSVKRRVGIIGLDTSHSEVFTSMINSGEISGDYKVMAACSQGSTDIPAALKIKPRVTKAVREMGVEIVDSIDILLGMVDVVLLETIDGRPQKKVQAVVNGSIGKVIGADVYTPAEIEPHHMDLAW